MILANSKRISARSNEGVFIKKSVEAMNNMKAGSGEEWATKWQSYKTELIYLSREYSPVNYMKPPNMRQST